MSTTSVLTDISPDSTLLAIHTPLPSTSVSNNKRRLTVQIRDARTGITKYTLSYSPDDDDGDDDDDVTIRRLYFASNTHLCALLGQYVLIWDLNRGVISHTISPPKKHVVHSLVTIPRSSGGIGEEEEADGSKGGSTVLVLCEKVKDGNKLYLFEYDVYSGKLVRKIKSGSRDITTTTNDKDEDGGVSVDVDVSNNGKLISVWNGSTNHIRLMNGMTGDKIDRIKVKDHDIVTTTSMRRRKVMNLSNDGKILCVQTNIGLCLYEVMDVSLVGKIQTDKSIISASCNTDDDGHYTISIQSDDDTVQLYHLDLAKGGKKHVLKPITTISSSAQQQSLGSVHFYQDKLKIISLSGVGGGSRVVEVHDVNYREKVSNELIVGEIKIGTTEDEEDSGEKKKRKVDKVYKTGVVMGPSESGKEITPNMMMEPGNKKAKKLKGAEEDDDMDTELAIEDEEEGDGDTTTIGERLKRLTAELDRDYDTDDDEEKQRKQNKITPFNNKTNPATTESLTTLLQQALNSNDDTMLEIALNVGDKRVVESTVMSLTTTEEDEVSSGMVLLTKLLTKLSTKLCKTPSRSEQLSVWIRFVLIAFTTTRNNNDTEEEEIRNILEALRNLLNERVESLPHLLRLEGRLALLGGASAGY